MKTPTRTTPARAQRPAAAARPSGCDGAAIRATHFVGTVTSRSPAGGFAIRNAAFQAEGRRAASCLLEPMPGDSVACLRVAPHETWIVAVLQREEGATHVLRAQGPARLESAGGSLTLGAAEVAIDSARFHLQARHAELAADDVQLTSRQARLVGGSVKLIGTLLSTVFDRAVHFSRQHTRTTEGLDRVRATQLDCEAGQLMSLSAEHLLVQGEKLVKARGGQIHFG